MKHLWSIILLLSVFFNTEAAAAGRTDETQWMFTPTCKELSASYGEGRISFRSDSIRLDTEGKITFAGMHQGDWILFTKPLHRQGENIDIDFFVALGQETGATERQWAAEYLDRGVWKDFGRFTTMGDSRDRTTSFLGDFSLPSLPDTLKIRCRILSDNPGAVNFFRLEGWMGASISVHHDEPLLADAQRLLVIGNSFTYFYATFQMLEQIARSQGHDLHIRTHQDPGATFARQLATPLTLRAIREGNYDYAIIQDQSSAHERFCRNTAPDHSVLTDTRRLRDSIRVYSPHARILLENTWSYPKQDYMGYGNLHDFGAMLAKGCESIAGQLELEVSPICKAFEKAVGEGIQVYYKDHHHPSVQGAYLKACVNYLLLYGTPFQFPACTCGLEPEIALQLQQIALAAVLD